MVICAQCGRAFPFERTRPNKQFCDRKCSASARPPRPPRFCSVEPCNRPYYGRGWCRNHYMRWRKKGTVELTRQGPLRERFPRFVDNSSNECWRWLGAISKRTGYGRTSDESGRSISAHRASYMLYVGPIPPGKIIRHLCNNRWCVNPSHLTTGTHKDNMADSIAAGTFVRGSKNGCAKLVEQTVREIRSRHGVPYPRLAAEYGVSTCTIGEIMRRESWAHLD